MTRQNFTRAPKVAMIKRATRDGAVYCEGCGLPTRKFEFDHTIADGLRVDKSKPLTAEDGKLLCKDAGRQSCHGRKTAEQDVPAIAKAKRREAKALGATRSKQSIKSPSFKHVDRPHADRGVATGLSEIMRRFGAR